MPCQVKMGRNQQAAWPASEKLQGRKAENQDGGDKIMGENASRILGL